MTCLSLKLISTLILCNSCSSCTNILAFPEAAVPIQAFALVDPFPYFFKKNFWPRRWHVGSICLLAKPFRGSLCPPHLLLLVNVTVSSSCIFCFSTVSSKGISLPAPSRFLGSQTPRPNPKAPLASWLIKPTQRHLLKLQRSWETGAPIVSGSGRG